jgi:hypothetical protein
MIVSCVIDSIFFYSEIFWVETSHIYGILMALTFDQFLYPLIGFQLATPVSMHVLDYLL